MKKTRTTISLWATSCVLVLLAPPCAAVRHVGRHPQPSAIESAGRVRRSLHPRYRLQYVCKVERDAEGDSIAYSINNHGEVTGGLAVYRNGHRTRLRKITLRPGTTDLRTCGINSAGDIIGNMTGTVDGAGGIWEDSGAILWHHGRPRLLLPESRAEHSAVAINDKGDVALNVFDYSVPNPDYDRNDEAYLIRHGHTVHLGTGLANCLNNNGQVLIARIHAHQTPPTELYIWDNGKVIHPKLANSANDITYYSQMNNKCQIVGQISDHTAGGARGFLWSRGKLTKIVNTFGGANSIALGVNEKSQVVGNADVGPLDKNGKSITVTGPNDVPVTRAFLFAHGQLTDLNRCIPRHSGWTLSSAVAINDLGDIVCIGNKGVCLLVPLSPL